VDAKERLRLYLEQRRDAGESELVLDSMSVEEVMRLLGAGGSATGRAPERAAERSLERPVRPSVPPSDAPPTHGAARDWREALRALDAQPGGAKGTAAPQRPEAPPMVRTDDERAPAPATRPPLAGVSQGVPQGVPPDALPDAPPSPPMPAPSPDRPPRDAGQPPTIPLDQVPAGLVVGAPGHDGGSTSPWHTIDEIAEATRRCQACSLHKTARQAVPGEGNPEADFVCVGEAPGANEDEQGRPFVGQAGQLLTKILAAIDLSRDQVFICNVLKHRPPGNRNPTPEEVAACSPFLVRQIELLQPKVILALGTFAAQTLLQTREPIGKLRGKIHRYHGVPLIVTYHPAALLRNPSWKRPTWEDVQLARRILDRARGA